MNVISCRGVVFRILKSLSALFALPTGWAGNKAHKPVELLSVLYLLVHLWAGYLNAFF